MRDSMSKKRLPIVAASGTLADGQCFDRPGGNLVDALGALLLAGDAESFLQVGFDQGVELADEFFVLRGGRPVPFRLAGGVDQFVDRRDDRLHLLVDQTTAPSIVSSERMSASDSTISTADCVPATTRSRRLSLSCESVGLRTYWSLM